MTKATPFGNAAFAADLTQTIRIAVPGVVRLEGEACALSEIAELEGPDELTKQAGSLLLSVRNGVITRQQVVEALQVSGLEGVRVELKMPVSVTVLTEGEGDERASSSPPAGAGPGTDLASAVKKLAAWDGDVEVRHQGAVPPGRLVAPSSIVPGTPSATLKFRNPRGEERSLAVRLTWYQQALVLARSVKKDEPLRESDFVVRRVRISRPGIYASKLTEAVGLSLRKNLSQGEPVPLNLIAGVPIIERGKIVTIVARYGALAVKTRGEALEPGSAGETIKVRNLSSKTVLSAVVMDKDTVEVKMP
ncbi:MAG: flagellar basal body P-ring formation chaperone FlgA [Synergistaceae bacterium]|nr:flagellar basal body P-ring formation chaperone FlgA [Synergistaceae bacterium]